MSFIEFIKQNKVRKYLPFFLFALLGLSCTNNYTNPSRFKHNFQQGSADHLYNISDILGSHPILESEPVFFSSTKVSSSASPETVGQKQSLVKYPLLSSQGGYPKEILDSENISNLIKIKTAERGEKAAISFVQENIHIDPAISFINKYEILDYKILKPKKTNWNQYIAQLVGQVEKFKGFPNTVYYILPLFEGNHLVLYKLGPENKIPYDELPLAKRVGKLLAVPFVGYPIKYCIAEVIPDINERKTGQYKPKCEGIKLKFAEYIELKEQNKKIFNYTKKPDLFPRDFFTLKEKGKNNWFYVRTVVKSPKNTVVGHQLFQPANLVEFYPSHDKLDILDASGYNIKTEDKLRALFIPLEWVDFQIKRDSENMHPSFSEELKKDTQGKNLRYFKINFNKLVENEVEFKGEKTLKNVFITDSYFSFNVEITFKGSGAYLIKYAFFKKPANQSYVPKQWFEEDSALFFPSFSEERKYYENKLHFHSEEDHNRFLRTTRFDPKTKEIKWYFSKQTPKNDEDKWVREIGSLAVDMLNKAFEVAGRDSTHKIKIVLDDKAEDKEVGDIRYNILNLMLTKGKPDRGNLGLGPNVANPITGEVVSATANVWVSQVLNIYTKIVRKYIRFQVYPPAWSLQPFTKEMADSLKKKIHKKAPECGDLPFQPLGVTPFIHEKIEKLCPEVTDFIKKEKTEGLAYDPENPALQDKELIKTCAKKLAIIPVLGVTLHEMLHGFAQRHIFSASVDTENFYQNYEEIKKIFGTSVSDKLKELFGDFPYVEGTKCHPQAPKYSSVMDYMSFHNPILFVPGKLDIATLRFIYFDKVDLKNGSVLEVPSGADSDPEKPQKSILQTIEDKPQSRKNLKSYKILCGGEKIDKDYKEETNPQQPLCKRFDYGENPLEIVVNSILFFNNYILTNGRNRYDSKHVRSSIKQFIPSINQIVGDLYRKWEQYRDELLNQNNQNIENYSFLSSEDIAQYQRIIEEERSQNPDFEMYYDIRKPIFSYLKRLLFMPSKHCIYKNWQGSDKYHARALRNIINEEKADYLSYPEDSKERLINCQSSPANEWAKNKGELVAEVGFFGQQTKYFLRPKQKQDIDERSAFDIWPYLMVDRENKPAGLMINSNEFSPLINSIKEPDFGNEYYQAVLSYMLEGTDLNSYINPYYLTKNPNIFQEISDPSHLGRVLTYKTDKDNSLGLNGWINTGKGILRRRLAILESTIASKLQNHRRNEFELHFGWDLRKLTDIGLTIESIKNNGDYLFFDQVYQDYLKSFSGSDSLGSFIKNHPASLYDKFKHSWIVIPYTNTTDSLPARLFHRFNEFKDCIEKENQLGTACKDRAEKRAYINTILQYYYQDIIEKETELNSLSEDEVSSPRD